MTGLIARSNLLLAAFGASLVCLGTVVSPGAANAATHRFVAELAAPAGKAKLVSSDVAWRCAGNTCTANAEMTTAPRRFCARFVREAGSLLAFRVDDEAFSDDQLSQCNAAAD